MAHELDDAFAGVEQGQESKDQAEREVQDTADVHDLLYLSKQGFGTELTLKLWVHLAFIVKVSVKLAGIGTSSSTIKSAISGEVSETRIVCN